MILFGEKSESLILEDEIEDDIDIDDLDIFDQVMQDYGLVVDLDADIEEEDEEGDIYMARMSALLRAVGERETQRYMLTRQRIRDDLRTNPYFDPWSSETYLLDEEEMHNWSKEGF